jgi:hypothetical protein
MTGRATFLVPLLAAASAALAGCALSGDAAEVTIEHFAEYPGVAQMLAEDHCAKFGKTAKLVQVGLQDTYALGIRKRVSVFHCVDAPGKKQP